MEFKESTQHSTEMLDVVDEHDKPLGFTKLRTEVHRDGDWHREVHVWVYNGKGELLFQLRGPNQESFPNCWDVSVGGHVSAGSEYADSALKELEEELGIKAHAKDLQIIKYWQHHELHDEGRKMVNRAHRMVYGYRYEGKVHDLVPEAGAIAGLKFLTYHEMLLLPEHFGEGIAIIPGSKTYFTLAFEKVRDLLLAKI